MWFLKFFAIIIPIWILVSIVSGELSIMNQLDKSRSGITFDEQPLRFIATILVFIVLEYYLVKMINASRADND